MNNNDIEIATQDFFEFVADALSVVSIVATSPIWLPFYVLRKLREWKGR